MYALTVARSPVVVLISQELDGFILLHAATQGLAWLVLFPTGESRSDVSLPGKLLPSPGSADPRPRSARASGMVLGLTKSRWHVPLQSITVLISLFGNYLGHHHGGRSFHSTAHSHSSKCESDSPGAEAYGASDLRAR